MVFVYFNWKLSFTGDYICQPCFFCSLYILRDKLSCFYYISTIFFALRYMYYVYWLCLLWLKNGGNYVLRWERRVSIKLSYLLIKNIGKGVQLKQL